MDAEAFLALALNLPETALANHMRARDIRVRGKIFAGPADGEGGTAVIKLTAEQQEMMCGALPDVFRPEAGYWGRVGWTRMTVGVADEDTARRALWTAWRNVAPSSLAKLHPADPGGAS